MTDKALVKLRDKRQESLAVESALAVPEASGGD